MKGFRGLWAWGFRAQSFRGGLGVSGFGGCKGLGFRGIGV